MRNLIIITQTILLGVFLAVGAQAQTVKNPGILVHAADVEGLQAGIDQDLVSLLGNCCNLPVTYAGGARSLQDLELVKTLSKGKVDLTIGSALDIFGGSGVTLKDCINWNGSQLSSQLSSQSNTNQ